MLKFRLIVAVFMMIALGAVAPAQKPAVAATPPMGWNSWNHFAGRVDDADVRAAADAVVSSGMKAAGYKYINIDDTWQGQRDAQGYIHPNSKFPDMKALADYVHSKGLKLGIYSSPGPKTCAGYPGSYEHEQQDAETYAKWGIDYLKYDLCSYNGIMNKEAPNDLQKQNAIMIAAYAKMHAALQATRRPIIFSLCQYGRDDVWTWGVSVGGNLWRTTGDIRDDYKRMADIGFNQIGMAKYAGPGHWNDPDMLEIGNGGMNFDEEKTHMSLWAILAAPLIAGNDLSHMSPETLSTLTNREVIAVDQDRLGKEGTRASIQGQTEVWTRPLTHGAVAAGLFNRDTVSRKMTLNLNAFGFGPHAKLRDLWTHTDVMPTNGQYTVNVPPHGVVMLRVSH